MVREPRYVNHFKTTGNRIKVSPGDKTGKQDDVRGPAMNTNMRMQPMFGVALVAVVVGAIFLSSYVASQR